MGTPPGSWVSCWYHTSYHINIYLPTSGKDAEYIDELSKLNNFIESVDKSSTIIYVRGDANASYNVRKRNPRDQLFKHFISDLNLNPKEINHKTIIKKQANKI